MEMKEQWLMPGAVVPVDAETTAALVAEIKRLICVVGGMALDMQPAQQQEPVAFYVYKPTLPRGNLGNVSDGDLPWVYDQDPSSGFSARMLVTPFPPPRKPWVGLTADEVWQSDEVMALNAEMGLPMNQIMALIVWANAKLKEKNT